MQSNIYLIGHARVFSARGVCVCVYVYIFVTCSFILYHAVYVRVTVKVIENWTRLPREAVDSPSLDVMKIHLCYLLLETCFRRDWTQ